MTDDRPDPDDLLAQAHEAERAARRGHLKIFFGASAGVGKTCAMLAQARLQREQGVDVVIGVVETHGRADTAALVGATPVIPRRDIAHHGRTLPEFDLDAVLQRRPALVLVDELAHSNVAGARHPKRWQDVEELLANGIDVWTTMNVQHLESLNDVVNAVAGVRVRETVPDHVFDDADDVVLVDLPPDELLQRLKEGKVYIAPQAERAASSFFRKGNLLALRELALRRTADRVDVDMLSYRRGLKSAAVWPAREALLACVGPGGQGEKLVRAAARLAAQLGAPWHAVYVETPALQRLPRARREQVLRVLTLAQDLGARTATLASDAAAPALARYAREHNLMRVVMGRRGALKPWWRRDTATQVAALAPDLELVQVALPPRERGAVAHELAARLTGDDTGRPLDWWAYAKSVAVCAAVILATAPLLHVLEPTNIVMLLLLAVVFSALRYGRGPAVLASFVSVAAFDFFDVAPRFTFAVSDVQYLVTFAVMLIVALVIGQLTAGLTYQARVATLREDRVRALYELSRDLAAALMPEQIVEIGTRVLQAEFEARAVFLLLDDEDRLVVPEAAGVDASLAGWALAHAEAAGQGTGTLPASAMLYVPLKAPMRVRGVVALALRNPQRLNVPEQRRLLDTFASLLAIALERIHYVDVAQRTTVQMESERLRNALLGAISHDLRTPLAALAGMADSLQLTTPPLAPAHAEIAQALREAALRMNALVNNLLDMARLESGRVALNLQWQPLEEVVGSALRSLGGLFAGRHPIRVALPADLPLLQFDAVLIERVLANLLENAAKYTPAGSAISIGAAATRDSVEVWVADEGPGLPPGREELIFEKFERGRKESATPGVGLGLAICRAIVVAHGGAIRGETRPEGGARFVFTLPRGEAPHIEEPADDADNASMESAR
ncbi:MAG: two-component system sensor histidine kinase KdpD [Vitreoscilla sp.]